MREQFILGHSNTIQNKHKDTTRLGSRQVDRTSHCNMERILDVPSDTFLPQYKLISTGGDLDHSPRVWMTGFS